MTNLLSRVGESGTFINTDLASVTAEQSLNPEPKTEKKEPVKPIATVPDVEQSSEAESEVSEINFQFEKKTPEPVFTLESDSK